MDLTNWGGDGWVDLESVYLEHKLCECFKFSVYFDMDKHGDSYQEDYIWIVLKA